MLQKFPCCNDTTSEIAKLRLHVCVFTCSLTGVTSGTGPGWRALASGSWDRTVAGGSGGARVRITEVTCTLKQWYCWRNNQKLKLSLGLDFQWRIWKFLERVTRSRGNTNPFHLPFFQQQTGIKMKRLVQSEEYFRFKPPFLKYANDFVVQRNTTKEKNNVNSAHRSLIILCDQTYSIT